MIKIYKCMLNRPTTNHQIESSMVDHAEYRQIYGLEPPYCRLWTKLRHIKCKYSTFSNASTLSNSAMLVAAEIDEGLDDDDPDRWVEVPYDWLKNTTLAALAEEKTSSMTVSIETRRTDGVWPRAHNARRTALGFLDWWRGFLQSGDIVDVMDGQGKWYESVLRFVYPVGHEKHGMCIVHYIGWKDKCDEGLQIESKRIAERNAHTTGPYKVRSRDLDDGVVLGVVKINTDSFMQHIIQCLMQSSHLAFFVNNNCISLNQDYFVCSDKGRTPLVGEDAPVLLYWCKLINLAASRCKTADISTLVSKIEALKPTMSEQNDRHRQCLSSILSLLHRDCSDSSIERTQSFITDYFAGQFVVSATCSACGHSWDSAMPYHILSVPIPIKRTVPIGYTFIDCANMSVITRHIQEINIFADVGELKQEVAVAMTKRCKVQNQLLLVGYAREHEAERGLSNDIIRTIFAFYLIADIEACELTVESVVDGKSKETLSDDTSVSSSKCNFLWVYHGYAKVSDCKIGTDEAKFQTFIVENKIKQWTGAR